MMNACRQKADWCKTASHYTGKRNANASDYNFSPWSQKTEASGSDELKAFM